MGFPYWNRTTKAVLFILIIAVIAAACIYRARNNSHDENSLNLTAWIVDWDYEAGIQDFENLEGKLSELQVFAAYFDYKDKLCFTEKFHSLARHLAYIDRESSNTKVYLTIVNDRFDEKGKPVQKDSFLLSKLMASEETIDSHIDEIVAAIQNRGFDGVEIDYEKIPHEIYGNYAVFCEELYKRTSELGMQLRIVLEPGVDLNRLLLPEGPQYVIMAYNLHGYHSRPGPKADFKFIRRVASKLAKLPGDNNYLAFATGGFDWSDDGKVAALSEKQAAELAARHKSKTKRDKNSGAVYFEYSDVNNGRHTIWYADGDTLEGWVGISKELGCYNIALWRLGGNSQQTLGKYFMEGL